MRNGALRLLAWTLLALAGAEAAEGGFQPVSLDGVTSSLSLAWSMSVNASTLVQQVQRLAFSLSDQNPSTEVDVGNYTLQLRVAQPPRLLMQRRLLGFVPLATETLAASVCEDRTVYEYNSTSIKADNLIQLARYSLARKNASSASSPVTRRLLQTAANGDSTETDPVLERQLSQIATLDFTQQEIDQYANVFSLGDKKQWLKDTLLLGGSFGVASMANKLAISPTTALISTVAGVTMSMLGDAIFPTGNMEADIARKIFDAFKTIGQLNKQIVTFQSLQVAINKKLDSRVDNVYNQLSLLGDQIGEVKGAMEVMALRVQTDNLAVLNQVGDLRNSVVSLADDTAAALQGLNDATSQRLILVAQQFQEIQAAMDQMRNVSGTHIRSIYQELRVVNNRLYDAVQNIYEIFLQRDIFAALTVETWKVMANMTSGNTHIGNLLTPETAQALGLPYPTPSVPFVRGFGKPPRIQLRADERIKVVEEMTITYPLQVPGATQPFERQRIGTEVVSLVCNTLDMLQRLAPTGLARPFSRIMSEFSAESCYVTVRRSDCDYQQGLLSAADQLNMTYRETQGYATYYPYLPSCELVESSTRYAEVNFTKPIDFVQYLSELCGRPIDGDSPTAFVQSKRLSEMLLSAKQFVPDPFGANITLAEHCSRVDVNAMESLLTGPFDDITFLVYNLMQMAYPNAVSEIEQLRVDIEGTMPDGVSVHEEYRSLRSNGNTQKPGNGTITRRCLTSRIVGVPPISMEPLWELTPVETGAVVEVQVKERATGRETERFTLTSPSEVRVGSMPFDANLWSRAVGSLDLIPGTEIFDAPVDMLPVSPRAADRSHSLTYIMRPFRADEANSTWFRVARNDSTLRQYNGTAHFIVRGSPMRRAEWDELYGENEFDPEAASANLLGYVRRLDPDTMTCQAAPLPDNALCRMLEAYRPVSVATSSDDRLHVAFEYRSWTLQGALLAPPGPITATFHSACPRAQSRAYTSRGWVEVELDNSGPFAMQVQLERYGPEECIGIAVSNQPQTSMVTIGPAQTVYHRLPPCNTGSIVLYARNAVDRTLCNGGMPVSNTSVVLTQAQIDSMGQIEVSAESAQTTVLTIQTDAMRRLGEVAAGIAVSIDYLSQLSFELLDPQYSTRYTNLTLEFLRIEQRARVQQAIAAVANSTAAIINSQDDFDAWRNRSTLPGQMLSDLLKPYWEAFNRTELLILKDRELYGRDSNYTKYLINQQQDIVDREIELLKKELQNLKDLAAALNATAEATSDDSCHFTDVVVFFPFRYLQCLFDHSALSDVPYAGSMISWVLAFIITVVWMVIFYGIMFAVLSAIAPYLERLVLAAASCMSDRCKRGCKCCRKTEGERPEPLPAPLQDKSEDIVEALRQQAAQRPAAKQDIADATVAVGDAETVPLLSNRTSASKPAAAATSTHLSSYYVQESPMAPFASNLL